MTKSGDLVRDMDMNWRKKDFLIIQIQFLCFEENYMKKKVWCVSERDKQKREREGEREREERGALNGQSLHPQFNDSSNNKRNSAERRTTG